MYDLKSYPFDLLPDWPHISPLILDLWKKHRIKLKPTWIFTPEFEASYLYFSNFVKLSAS